MRVQADNKRVDASEIYAELMSLKGREFITEEDRTFLMGLPPAPAKVEQMPAESGGIILSQSGKRIGRR
jgi:hypothetical protein